MEGLDDFVKQLNQIVNAPSVTAPLVKETETVVTESVEGASKTSGKTVKVLFVSTHVNQANGYSKVAYNVIQQLARHNWIQVVHFGTQRIVNGDLGRKYPVGVKVLDATAMEKEKQKQAGFAFAELPGVIRSEKPDVVFLYNDLSIVCGYMEEIRKSITERSFKIWAYVDITYQSPPVQMIDILNRDAERVFCFTKGWKDHIKTQGITRPVDVLNHGVDTTMFRTVPRDLARQTLGLPKDMFLFLSLNKNIPRKRLDLLVMSFVKLIIRFPAKPIFLLIVADKGDLGGFPLFEIFARELRLEGVSVDVFGNRLLITSKDTCYRDEDVNLLYNSADAGVSCADGEGFGLCTFEGMATGVPQIVPAIQGYKEYCTEQNSLMVPPKTRHYIPQALNVVTGEAEMVGTEDMAKAMERYVFAEDLRRLHGKNGKETVTAYTWEKCCAVLVKRLQSLREEDED